MNQKVIDVLNAARAAELTAIMQYMADHYVQADRGFSKLADEIKKIAIVEMKHAESLAERILYLGGVPMTKPDGTVKPGQSIPEMLETARDLEAAAIKMHNASAILCSEEGDRVSKDLFEQILAAEEDHWDYFDTTHAHVEHLGDAYLAMLAD